MKFISNSKQSEGFMQCNVRSRWNKRGLITLVSLLIAFMFLLPAPANALIFEGEASPAMERLTPIEAETRPQLYDLQSSVQVQYWSAVIDRLAQRVKPYIDDSEGLNTASKMWNLLEEKSLGEDITYQEAQILCLYMSNEEEAPPEGLIEDFPEWPECGGVLEEMFGDDIITYWLMHQDISSTENAARMAIFVSLLSNMGLSFAIIDGTIEERIARTFPILAGQEDTFGVGYIEDPDDRECHTAEDNIERYVVGGCGILCSVTRVIVGLLNTASSALFNSFISNTTFQSAIIAAFVLYTVIYGAMVLLGFVPVVLGDALMRLAKIGIVAMLLTSETAHTLFNLVRCFFIEGTTYLINQVSMVGLEAVAQLGVNNYQLQELAQSQNASLQICSASHGRLDEIGAGPLVVLEALLTQIFSPQMMLVIITLFLSSIQGLIMVVFLLFGLYGALMAILSAVTIYLTALIAQYLLLSLLPIFVAFLLFDQTKALFRGWINQLVTYSLTPIFLFAYISLFIVVLEAALAPILDVKICLDKWLGISWPFDLQKYYFTTPDGISLESPPFGYFELFIFILLAYLMKEFHKNVEDLAREIGGSYVYVDGAAKALKKWFDGKKDGLKNTASQQAVGGVRAAGRVARRSITTGKTPDAGPDVDPSPTAPRRAPQVPPAPGGGGGMQLPSPPRSRGTVPPPPPKLPKPPGGT